MPVNREVLSVKRGQKLRQNGTRNDFCSYICNGNDKSRRNQEVEQQKNIKRNEKGI